MLKDEALEKLQNKNLDIKEVEKIYKNFSNDKETVGAIAMNLSMRTSVYDRKAEKSEIIINLLIKLSDFEDMGVRWAVAKNPHTPTEILEKLSKDKINLVRALCATNPNTPKNILAKLFSDEKIVRDGLSGNPKTPLKYLNILADDRDKMVRLRVAENSSSSKEILEKLTKDDDKDVAKAAAVHLEKLNTGDKI